MQKLSTTTLTDSEGNPTLITCPGHVGLQEFNDAMAQEWECDPIEADRADELRHEYWISSAEENVQWEKVTKDHPKGKPFTVMAWD